MTLVSVRLDRYCSTPEYVDLFGRETEVYVMPKSNATLSGSWRSKETMIEFVNNAVKYLEEYHKRCNSESGFAWDKKVLGWSIAQRRGTGLTAPTSAPGYGTTCLASWPSDFCLSRVGMCKCERRVIRSGLVC